jgi:hypothetical protein
MHDRLPHISHGKVFFRTNWELRYQDARKHGGTAHPWPTSFVGLRVRAETAKPNPSCHVRILISPVRLAIIS